MSAHLSSTMLNGLVDGELSADQLAAAQEHLDQCPACTSNALAQTFLKRAVARTGQRYALPPVLEERLKQLASQIAAPTGSPPFRADRKPSSLFAWRPAFAGWAVAAVLLLAATGVIFMQRKAQTFTARSVQRAALVTEICDLHVATLAAGLPPQVISTDRHTVKPWFQGKIPFSFNLPGDLPADTKLDGANLNYLQNQPVAQLLYSIGHHRVSVFIRQRATPRVSNSLVAEHSGFEVNGFYSDELEVVAVSDVDPVRLADLIGRLKRSQTTTGD
jgi:anti-sigma factor RsiW